MWQLLRGMAAKCPRPTDLVSVLTMHVVEDVFPLFPQPAGTDELERAWADRRALLITSRREYARRRQLSRSARGVFTLAAVDTRARASGAVPQSWLRGSLPVAGAQRDGHHGFAGTAVHGLRSEGCIRGIGAVAMVCCG